MGKLSSAKKLSKVEKACINGMMAEGFDVPHIARTLDRDVGEINYYLNHASQEKVEPSETKPKKDNFYINKTAAGKEGVTISTPTSSERSDEGYRHRLAARKKNQQDYIFKMHNESEEV